MFLSVTELFKPGIGPSSSHTMGPMVAARRFLDLLGGDEWVRAGSDPVRRVRVRLLGSLAFTGKGHATDRAVALGLLGFAPDTVDMDEAEAALARLVEEERLAVPGRGAVGFHPVRDVVFDYETPPGAHPNALTFEAIGDGERVLMRRTYFSVGGGFLREESEFGVVTDDPPAVPHPFRTAAEMLEMAQASGRSIAQMKAANERAAGVPVDQRLDAIAEAMDDCIERGLKAEGILPGGLQVRRRARGLHAQLMAEGQANMPSPTHASDWLSLFALAVNEENAAGGRVVTAPTNGAAGVVPAVLRYARQFEPGTGREQVHTFLLTAAAIGGLLKANASISGAEVGCQGEVGSASAMAAAGFAAIRGGTPAQVENAAEIALEHHLGMTCDPVAGLVQVPCIERNAFGAIKAVAAASLALRGDGTHVVPLDVCIETMRQTGADMDERYRETSRGGLAANVSVANVAC